MIEELQYVKECGTYYMLTMNDDFPAGRPFGSLDEYEGNAYFTTTDLNEVHKQLRKNGHIQILAKKPDGREWVRITANAVEITDLKTKEAILDLRGDYWKTKFLEMGIEHFLPFRIDVIKAEKK